MKKIILLFLTLFCVNAYSQRPVTILDNWIYSDKGEVHIDYDRGVDTLDYCGSDVSSFKTYAFYKYLLATNNGNPFYNTGNSGAKICIHTGVSPEVYDITNQNTTLTAAHVSPDGLTKVRRINVNSAGSVRIVGLTIDTLVISGAGSTYIYQCTVNNLFTKSGNGYVDLSDDSKICQTGTASITGTGTVLFNSCIVPGFTTISNANANVTMRNVVSGGGVNLAAGVLVLDGGFMFTPVAGTAAITTSAGTTLKIENMNIVEVSGILSRISVGGFISYSNTKFDRANTTNLGTNLNNTTWFDNVGLLGNIPIVTGQSYALVQGASGNISRQLFPTGSSSLPSSGTGFLNNIGGTNNWRSLAWSDMPSSGAAGGSLSGTYPNPTLANVITAGTTSNIQYNSAGQITSIIPLNASHIPNLSATKITSDSLPIARGGTGRNTIGAANTIAYSDGSAYKFVPAPSADGQVLSRASGALSWQTLGGATVDVNNIYVSTSGSDVPGVGNGSLLKPYATTDTAAKYCQGSIILMSSNGGYGQVYLQDVNVNGLLSQVSAPATKVLTAQVTISGNMGYNFNMKSIMSQSLWFLCYQGGANVENVLLYPNTNGYALVIKANLLASQPAQPYRFNNVNFNYSNQANVKPIVLYNSPYPVTLILEECTNARIYFSNTLGTQLVADSIPQNWTIKYRSTSIVTPKNATTTNFINLVDADFNLADLGRNSTTASVNGTNQLVKTNSSGKIPSSLIDLSGNVNYSSANLKLTANQTLTSANQTIIMQSAQITGSSGISYNSSTGVITLDAGGTYRLMGSLGLFNSAGGWITFQFYDQTSSTFLGSSGIIEAINNNTAYAHNTLAFAEITTTASTSVSLRVVTISATSPVAKADNSFISIQKVASTVQLTPSNSVGFLKADMTTAQSITTVNTNIIFNTSSVTGTGMTYNSSTGAIVLDAGSTYKLTGNLSFNGNTTCIDGGFVFYNNNTSSIIGSSSISLVGINYNSTLTSSNSIIEYFTPSVQTTVYLRCNYKGTGTIQLGAGQSWVTVEKFSNTIPVIPTNALARSSLCMMATVQQTAITTGGAVVFAETMGTPMGNDISYNAPLFTFTLKSGKAYRIDLEVPWGFGGYANFALFGKRFDTGVNGYIKGAGSSGVSATTTGAYWGSTPITYETPMLTEDWSFRVIVSATDASGTLQLNDPSIEIKARILINAVAGQMEVVPIMPTNPTGLACFAVSAPTTVSAGAAVIFSSTRTNTLASFVTNNTANGEISLKCNNDGSSAVYKLEFDLGVVSDNGSQMFVTYAFYDNTNNVIQTSRGGYTASPTLTSHTGELNNKATYTVEVSSNTVVTPKIVSASNANQYSANLIHAFGGLGRGQLVIEKIK